MRVGNEAMNPLKLYRDSTSPRQLYQHLTQVFCSCCLCSRFSSTSTGSVFRLPTASSRVSTHLDTFRKLSIFMKALPALQPSSPSFSIKGSNLDRKYGLDRKFLYRFF